MMDYIVLGAGISGATISNHLKKKYSVLVIDKARGPGGRSSNRRWKKNLTFDHGLQYFSSNKRAFLKNLSFLAKKKVLKVWDGNHLDFFFSYTKSKKFIGVKGNNDLVKHYLRNTQTLYKTKIVKINFKNHWTICDDNKNVYNCKKLIITFPYDQTLKLARKYLGKKIKKLKIKMEPNLTVMAVYKKRKKVSLSSIKFDDDILTWAANENSKNRFKSNFDLWTLQASNFFSKKHILDYKKNKNNISSKILKRFEILCGHKKKDLIYYQIHGWLYSYNKEKTQFSHYWNKKNKLGVCGDWFLGPKAENSFLSANSLYNEIK